MLRGNHTAGIGRVRLAGRLQPRRARHAAARGLGVPIRRQRVPEHLRRLGSDASDRHADRELLQRRRPIRSAASASAPTSNARTSSRPRPTCASDDTRRRDGDPGRRGAKIVTRDKTQDRTNQNYNRGPAFTLADFGPRAAGEPGRFFDDRTQIRPDDQPGSAAAVLRRQPDPLRRSMRWRRRATRSCRISTAERAGDGRLRACAPSTFDRWILLAGVRVEHTSGDYTANELLLEQRDVHRQHPAGGGRDVLHGRPPRRARQRPPAQEPHRSARRGPTRSAGPAYANLAPIKALDDLASRAGHLHGQPVARGIPD